jgi:predicted O-methyltransferase YrrM
MKKLEQIINNTRMVDDNSDAVDTLHGLVDLIKHIGGLRNKKALEVGCYRGVSSEVFLLHEPREMHFVDAWGKNENYTEANWALKGKDWENIKLEFENRINPYKENVDITISHDLSKEASKNIPDHSFDFIYIDGDHGYDGVKTDISCWLPKLSKNGYFCGHDYTYSPQIQKACHEVFDRGKIFTFSDSSFAVKID